MRHPLVLAASLCCCAPLWSQASSPRDLTACLPAGTPLVVDLTDGAACLERVLRLVEPVSGELPPTARLVLAGLPMLTKAATGLALSDLLEVVSPGHAVFALVFPEQGRPFPVLMTRVDEPDEIARVQRRVGQKLVADLSGGVLTVADSQSHLGQLLAFRRSGGPSLLADANYRAGRPALRPGRELRVYVDLARIRARTGRSLWDGSAAFVRLLVGPNAKTLDLASRLDARLVIEDAALRLVGRADSDLGGDAVARLRTGAARQGPSMPADAAVFLSLDRDLRALLTEPTRFFGRNGAVRVEQFLSKADQFLGGASLLDDLLPDVSMPIDVFVLNGAGGGGEDRPVVDLPGVAFVFGVAAGSDADELLDRAARVLTTIVNTQRLREKKPQVRLRRGRSGAFRYKSIEFADWTGPGRPPTEHGLSPTLLFAGGHGILASTAEAAVRMAESLAAGPQRTLAGDVLQVRGARLAELLARNRSVLITERVLKEGETRQEAANFFRIAESVLKNLDLDASILPGGGETRFELGLRRRV